MTTRAQTLLLTLIGSVGIKLVLSGAYTRYVNAWMKWPSLTASSLLLLLSFRYLLDRPDESGHSSEGHVVPKAAWLLMLPVVVVWVISPPALGAYAAERRPAATTPQSGYSALSRTHVTAMPINEFTGRAQWDPSGALDGRRVRLLGFVSRDALGHWFVTRLAISCCAADAVAYQVRIDGIASPPRDTWVSVTGIWGDPHKRATPRIGAPTLLADTMQVVPAPSKVYE